MEWGILVVVALGVFFGFLVLQATFAARHWRQVIAEGDPGALRQALDAAFDGWRGARPPKGLPPADWQGLQSATLVAADRDRCRVSLFASADVRVIDNQRRELGSARDVARRVAVAMAERVLYEIPHVHFEEIQIDVYGGAAAGDGASEQPCLLTTRVTRATAAQSEWDLAEPQDILAGWQTREAAPGRGLDPDDGALIAAEGEPVRPIAGAGQ